MPERLPARDYYGDPERYDAEYGPFGADRAWYVRRARELGAPVLELGCGTGRILLALAAEGLRVDGLDASPAMLDHLRTRAALLPKPVADRIGLFAADMRSFSLPGRYRAVLAPLNALMHLLTDAELSACLARVRNQLAAGGRFLFDTALPHPVLLEAAGESGAGLEVRSLRLRGRNFVQREFHRYDPTTGISRVRYTFTPEGGDSGGFATELRLRFLTPSALEESLAGAGLRIHRRYGNFEGGPFDSHGTLQVVEAVAEPNHRRPV